MPPATRSSAKNFGNGFTNSGVEAHHRDGDSDTLGDDVSADDPRYDGWTGVYHFVTDQLLGNEASGSDG